MSIEEQVAYLMQGTEYGDDKLKDAMGDELRQRLVEASSEGRPLQVYCGFDPTTSDLHLGHTVPMRKLRQFQKLGHEVTFLVGDYTSLIGDPSDKDRLRPQLTAEQISRNAHTYAEQAFRVLDRSKTRVRFNEEWLSRLSLGDMFGLASNFTIHQFLNRDNFKLRWERNEPIFLHETFYSIMQGYDAYTLRADVQVGGTDQLFNIVTAARKVMAFLGEKPNIAVILPILPGTDGEVKMSKSLGNHIPILAAPEDMYGKIMSLPDKAMILFYRLVTRLMPPEIEELEEGLESSRLHPRDVKMRLAREIVEIFHGTEAAQRGEEHFINVFQQGSLPEEMESFTLRAGSTVLDVLVECGIVGSKSEGRRLVSQNGVRLDGGVLTDPLQSLPGPGVLQVGKRRFIRIEAEHAPNKKMDED
jgi:tyrosyl-tRNA synthetase